jgi:hypothetical protein
MASPAEIIRKVAEAPQEAGQEVLRPADRKAEVHQVEACLQVVELIRE